MSPAERYAVVPDETVSLNFVNSTKLYIQYVNYNESKWHNYIGLEPDFTD